MLISARIAAAFIIATLRYRFMDEPVIRRARGLGKRALKAAPTLPPSAGVE